MIDKVLEKRTKIGKLQFTCLWKIVILDTDTDVSGKKWREKK